MAILIIIIILGIFFTIKMYNSKELKEEREDRKEYKKEIENLNTVIDKVQNEFETKIRSEAKQNISELNILSETSALHNQGKFLESIELCDKFLVSSPNNDLVNFIKADSLTLYGRKNKNGKSLFDAIAIIEKLKEKKDNDIKLYLVLGDAYLGLAFTYKDTLDIEEIIDFAKKSFDNYYLAHKMDLNNEEILARLALTKNICGDIDESHSFLERAKSINRYNKTVIEVDSVLNCD